jgi:lipid-binding SYLF domain-containing protein
MALARIFIIGLVVVVFGGLGGPTSSWAQEPRHSKPADYGEGPTTEEAERIHDSLKVLTELNATPDSAIPKHLLERAEAIVVIPSLVKGGFIVGAKHGKGIVSVRDRATSSWSAPAFMDMTGGSIGWQIGVESVDLVLLVMNKDGVAQLLDDRFTIGGSLGVTAGPVGRSAEASTNPGLDAGILAYSRSKGLFAGATLEGGGLRLDKSDNEDFYGKASTLREITGPGFGGTSLPAAAQAWKSSIARLTN